jgi:small-conductance mechanosensitive channel
MSFTNISWQEISQTILDFLPTLGLALLVLLAAYILSKWLTRVVRRGMQKRNQDPEMTILLEMLTRWGTLIIGIVVALQVLAPGKFASLLAGLGVAGVTIGFALQDVAKNFVAGILLLIQQPFDIGDTIEVSGYTGEVLKIALRATEMREVDGRYVIIPNGDVFVNPIVNFSRAPRRRIQLSVGVGYDSDLDKVARLANEAIQDLPGFLTDPSPSIVFDEFGGSAIGVKIYYWIDTDDTGVFDGTSEGLKLIKRAFEQNGIDMPFPTMTILSPTK